jgi:hypothetical protein
LLTNGPQKNKKHCYYNFPVALIAMEHEKLEFFKLDEIDRKVLLWLLSHVPQKSVLAWMDYIVEEYRFRKFIQINIQKLLEEIEQEELN